MKILVIGGAGREHALAWKLAQSPKVQCVYVAPGNGGTALDSRFINLNLASPHELSAWAATEKIALTVVGPEAPLAAGIVDEFRAKGLRIVGPTQAAAQLACSKAFAKAFMARHGIPAAELEALADAAPVQASFSVLCDGKSVAALATSQGYKRLHDGDLGPSTEGMGAYSPAPVLTPELHARAMREVIVPTIRGMEKDGMVYTGFLHASLMITAQGQIKTLDFNCCLGDPHAQAILMRLKNDLLDVLWAASEAKLDAVQLQWDRRVALSTALAAQGYPDQPRTGDVIEGLPGDGARASDDAMIFHAGTMAKDGKILTSAGRVLCVTVLADSVKQAQAKVAQTIAPIHFEGMQYRRDIAHRVFK